VTRVYDQNPVGGGARLLILGASAYPYAREAKVRVPRLPTISSAAQSALLLARRAMTPWAERLPKPLASIDLLVDDPTAPDGVKFTPPGGPEMTLDPPTMANVKAARRRWMAGAGPADILIFYCCGHGIWLAAAGQQTFLTASFGEDEDNPWRDAVALEDFAFALGEYPPRQQWLIFDCCNNTPTPALKALAPSPDPLLSSMEGQRALMQAQHGNLAQVTISSSTPGAESFGKPGRGSRFMEAFLDAGDGAGCRVSDQGTWWVDPQGIDDAIASFGRRVAPIEEEDYFRFPRLVRTDAAEPPRLLGYDARPTCTIRLKSEPPNRLKQANLSVTCRQTSAVVGQQARGPAALAIYRIPVSPWQEYDLEAAFAAETLSSRVFATPPLAEHVFRTS
jgi:hypothetical protein